MGDAPYLLDVRQAGHRLRAKQLTSESLTDACLARVAELNGSLRAFITVTAELAREQARDADRELSSGYDRGPLHGIPVSLKDLIDQAGVPTTAASRVRPMTPARSDAVVTARLRAAGAVLVGKTNLHEFALGTTSEDSAFGAVRHPQDPARSAGGSSGGSAAAVATGMSLVSIGTDTGGSIRIPAAACGVVGLKAGFGEVPCDGVVPLSHTLDHVGPLARTVAGAAAAYHVLTRGAVRTPVTRGLQGVRLGRLTGYFEEVLTGGVRAAYERALDRLRQGGAVIVDATLPHAAEVATIYLHIVLPEAALYHARTLERHPDRYTPAVRTRLEAGRYMLAEDYLRALEAREGIRHQVDAALAQVDALVLPTLPMETPPLGADTVAFGEAREAVRPVMLRLTQAFDVSGHPAIALPCGVGDRDLPVSLQLVGQHAGTGALLDLAGGVETQLAM